MDSLEELLEWMQTEVSVFWDDKKSLWVFDQLSYEWVEEYMTIVLESLAKLERQGMPIIQKGIVTETGIKYRFALRDPMKLYWEPFSVLPKRSYCIASIILGEGGIDYEVSIHNALPKPPNITVNQYVLSRIENMNLASHLIKEVEYYFNKYDSYISMKRDIYRIYARTAVNKKHISSGVAVSSDAFGEEMQKRLLLNKTLNQ